MKLTHFCLFSRTPNPAYAAKQADQTPEVKRFNSVIGNFYLGNDVLLDNLQDDIDTLLKSIFLFSHSAQHLQLRGRGGDGNFNAKSAKFEKTCFKF